MKLGSHLKKSAFKEFKAKKLHEVQNAILSMSQHQLSVVDEIVNKASEGKSLDLLHYPNVDISHLQETAKAYKGHTENHVKFARRARELKAGGLGSLFKSSLEIEDETEPEVQHTQQQQNLLDDLLDESDLEDEKEERGGSLEPRRQADHRWII